MRYTQHYRLPLFDGTDKPSILMDWNSTMQKIDDTLHLIEVGDENLPSIRELNEQVQGFESRLTSLSTTLSEGISALDTRVTTNESDISDLKSNVGFSKLDIIKLLAPDFYKYTGAGFTGYVGATYLTSDNISYEGPNTIDKNTVSKYPMQIDFSIIQKTMTTNVTNPFETGQTVKSYLATKGININDDDDILITWQDGGLEVNINFSFLQELKNIPPLSCVNLSTQITPFMAQIKQYRNRPWNPDSFTWDTPDFLQSHQDDDRLTYRSSGQTVYADKYINRRKNLCILKGSDQFRFEGYSAYISSSALSLYTAPYNIRNRDFEVIYNQINTSSSSWNIGLSSGYSSYADVSFYKI